MPAKRPVRRRVLAAGIAGACLAAAALAAWWWRAPAVALVQVATGPAARIVYASGTVEAGVTVRIAPRAAARLSELTAREGQAVRAGQLLARLEDRELAQSVEELAARAAYAAGQFDRQQGLSLQGFATQDRLDAARAERDAAVAALRRARALQGYMSITSPVDGVIIRRDGEVGDYVPVNQALYWIAAAGAAPRIEADVDEEDVVRVAKGQRVLVRAEAFPGAVIAGTVAEVTPKGDPVARSFRVRIALPADSGLRIGMSVETNIVVEERTGALLVPAAAVARDAVWTVSGGRLVSRPVKLGIRGPEKVEVLSGLAAGEWIVATAGEGFRAGERVRAAAAGAAGG